MQNPSIQEEYELSNISLAMRAKENEKNTSEQNIINAENGEMKDMAMDGGFDAWCTVVGGWLAMTATFGYQNAYGVYQDFYGLSHSASTSAISWIGSTQLFLLTSMGLFAGKLLDLGYFRQTIFAGSLLYVFSLFMLSLAHPDQYYQLFLSQGIGMGLGSGLIYIPCLAVQSHHWRTRRALALGIVFTGSSVGGIAFPIMLNYLLSTKLGFPWSVRVSAFVALVMLVLANILMRPRKEMLQGRYAPKPSIKSFFSDSPYVLLIVGAFFCLAGVFYPYFYVQVYARLHGVDDTVSFYMLAILNGSSIPGRVIPNLFVHKLGLFNMLLFSGIACAVLIFALFGINALPGITVFTILSGFFTGWFLSLLAAATASLARDPSEIGLRMGLAFALAALGSLIGTPIDGALLGESFIWWKTFIFSGTMIATGTILLTISRYTLAKHKGKSIV